MHQQQFSKIAELTNCYIGASCCLQTFDTTDADTDVCGLDHRDVVGAIADSKENSFRAPLNKLDDKCLLQR